MKLDAETRQLARSEGGEFFGVAALSPAPVRTAVVHQGGVDLAQYDRAVVVGIALLHSIVDQLSESCSPRVAEMYRYFCYDLVNDRLDKIAGRLSSLLQAKGYRALPVCAAPRVVDNERRMGIFSTKMAAHLAGLGWIGRNCLLVTPEVGPRVRWAAVLTNAPFALTGTPTAQRCGKCRACVVACPAHAFTGRSFRPDEPREARFRPEDCARHLAKAKERTGQYVCGLCLKVCPHGVKASRNTSKDSPHS